MSRIPGKQDALAYLLLLNIVVFNFGLIAVWENDLSTYMLCATIVATLLPCWLDRCFGG